LTFTSQHGLVRVSDLDIVSATGDTPAPEEKQEAPEILDDRIAVPLMAPTNREVHSAPAGLDPDDIFTKIERLADLHSKGILSDDEFAAKKTELLQRL
jgi:hypothetical protein